MTTLLIANKNISKIINGLEKLDNTEQLSILAQINATLILKKGVPSFTNPTRGLKPPTISQIDIIKHKVRKEIVHAK